MTAALLQFPTLAAWLPGMPPEASSEAGRTDALFYALCAASVFIVGIVVALVLLGIITRHKPKPQVPASRTGGRGPWLLETGWILATLAIFLFFFAWGARLYLDIYRSGDDALEVQVVARQWMWEFRYPNGYRSHNVLVLPEGVRVRLLMVSEDVIHSLFVPAFRMKQDVVPGRYQQMWVTPTRPGTYHLFCNEYCGSWHPSMRGEVRVLPPAEWARWLEQPGAEGIAAEGRALYVQQGCAGCHSEESAVHAPSLAGIFNRLVPVGNPSELVRADDAYLRDSILLPQKQVASGYEPVMPSYAGVLSEAQVLSLISYIKTMPPPTGPEGLETGSDAQ